MTLFALYSSLLVFFSVMSARSYYLRRIQELEGALALGRILRGDNESGNQESRSAGKENLLLAGSVQ